ncbi:TetR/AcrR family transcriptional regulator [Rhodococcus sp. HNM0563]|uniref:TetR/AcrR family transcriptional regulator n=1 Tax=unclassified Rhodococcus (in: high G+C Gram-positive bacteria) TaxID=192944 RepID=UPI00146D7486|nr:MULTISPECIES: TetR/AcrR family transcriptional regulator [unclassified Rhodococcus (in: high G+C Gram-positive bacteria)]MCK0092567.1 TetR/AcrR family transcriptional regulator [Rhodococcus sp. F64268]NLU64333.1 TetR/AcrR family transcriptional regulator [Rhodococcus sp. HNM0563]
MSSPGRPRLVTPERLVDAGARITLPKLSIRSIASDLGVSEMSVYRHVGDLDGLHRIVADGIVARTPLPEPTADDPEDALVDLALALRDFVVANPGIGRYLTALTPSSEGALGAIDRNQKEFADRYSWEPANASIALSVVAEHAVALAEINPVSHRDERDTMRPSRADGFRTINSGARKLAHLTPRETFAWSMRATARGVISMLGAGL